MSTLVEKIEFESEMILDGSFNPRNIGARKNSMELHKYPDGRVQIVWDVFSKDRETSTEIVLEYFYHEGTNIIYDFEGNGCSPTEANKLLEKHGWNIDEL